MGVVNPESPHSAPFLVHNKLIKGILHTYIAFNKPSETTWYETFITYFYAVVQIQLIYTNKKLLIKFPENANEKITNPIMPSI